MKNTKSVFRGRFFISAALFLSAAAQIFAAENYNKAVSKDISYNDVLAPGQLKKSPGMLSVSAPGPQQQAVLAGPQSFNSDDAGNVYICDTLNQSIQIYSPKGAFKKTVKLDSNAVASDICVDKNGDMYVFDDVDGGLFRFNKSGVFVSSIQVDMARITGGRGPMHMAAGGIYVPDVFQRDVLIGKIEKNALVNLSAAEAAAEPQKGINAPSGKKYYVELDGAGGGSLNIIGTDGKTSKTGIPGKGILSLTFMKEDRKGNAYVQAERRGTPAVLLEIHKFGPGGEHLAGINFTDTDYHFWTVKLFSVDDNENIYQFVPAQKKGKLNIFKK